MIFTLRLEPEENTSGKEIEIQEPYSTMRWDQLLYLAIKKSFGNCQSYIWRSYMTDISLFSALIG